MQKRELKLAAEMLRMAGEQFSNHGCNDWEFPADWTHEQKVEFAKKYHEFNCPEDEFDPAWLHLPDCGVMDLLASMLDKE